MDLDGFLRQKLRQELNKENIKIDVEELIHNVEQKKRKNEIKKISIAACIIILVIVLFPITLNKFQYVIHNNNESQIMADTQNEAYDKSGLIEIEYEDEGTMLKVGQIDYKYFMNRSLSAADSSVIVNIVIAKISNIEYYNYTDNLIKYGKSGEITTYSGYCLPRTRVDVSVSKVILGDLKEGDKIKAYANGGIVAYEEYKKYLDENLPVVDEDSIDLKYKSLIEEGKDNVYVSCFRKGDTHLENDKTYLMIIYEKNGEEYVDSSNYLLRECNLENNSVLNYKTGEWEKIQDVLGGFKYE